MEALASDSEPAGARGAARATRVMLFVIGLASGAWAPLVPFARQRLGVGDAELGLLLLCAGVGSILAMPIAGALAARFGCRRVLVVGSATLVLCFPALAIAQVAPALAAALFAFGAGVGTIDCVINMQAIVVEREAGRPMMSGFHALYSLGGIAGAGGVSALIGVGQPPSAAAICVAAVLALAAAIAWPGMMTRRAEAPGPALAIPHGAVVLIGAFCFIVFLTEGAALDWSALLLRTLRGASPAQAGLAYAAFSATMTAGRLGGDALVHRVGRLRTVVFGCCAAAVGLAAAALSPDWRAAVAGYAMVGAGCSNVVPVLFTLLGRQTDMPESQAVPAASVLGYAGLLTGPAAVGFVASFAGLPLALLGVALMLVLAAAGARRLRL
jgi:MFS family permease